MIKIYGEIWEWNSNSASNIMQQLEALVAKGVKAIKIHTHCKGGDVMEGFAIYNAIKSCKVPVDLYIDGVCASMMTVIMMACRNVYMAQNSMTMIHAPSGGAYGTAKVMQQMHKTLTSIEKNFIREYATKTGKTEKEVSKWLDGGDHWFNADEALAEKIINGIVNPVDESVLTTNLDEFKTDTVSAMYAQFTALNTDNNITKHPKKEKMDKEAVIKQFGLTSVTVESSEKDIYDAIEAKVKTANDAKATAEQTLQSEKEKQVTALVQSAIDGKKITAESKADFVAIGNTLGIEKLQTALGAIKEPITPITSMIDDGKGGKGGASTEPKTFGELVALGNATVADYKANKPDVYKALYKAEFGCEPNL